MQQKRWILLSKNNRTEDILKLRELYSIPPIIATILLNRGIDDVDSFINSTTDRLYDPYLMLDMDKAVDRILAALKNNEKITVYGDYDVDGITSTVIMTKFLKEHKADVSYYIPDRLEEGYGINTEAIDKIAAGGTTLLITVDCGVTAVAEIEYAKRKGIEVIITDHHECKTNLPSAYCILNPKREGCNYPFKKLAGVGVVFKLLQALTCAMRFHMTEFIDAYADLTALGTVADVMPLIGENRIIVKKGLEMLPYTMNKGLKALMEQAEIELSDISTGTVGFMIAPRINAAGRMGDPKCAVELLLSKDDMTAKRYAEKLDEENKERQANEAKIMDDAVYMLENNKSFAEDYVLVLAHEDWHHGIIGIVASKILEKYHKPIILISTGDGVGKGSCRSIKTFNLFKALENTNDLLLKFGGHELAAGLSIERDKIDLFRKRINEYAKEMLTEDDFIPRISIDAELPIRYININTVERFMILEPYGMGNSGPAFFSKGLVISNIKPLSEGKHMKLVLTNGQSYVDAIGFNMSEYLNQLKIGDVVDVVFNLNINSFRGERHVQMLLKDMRFSDE